MAFFIGLVIGLLLGLGYMGWLWDEAIMDWYNKQDWEEDYEQ